jgi:hypothetical protein
MAATVGIIGAVGSVAQAGSGILGGIMGGNASSKAAAAQQQELDKAMAFQQQVYGTAQTNMQPWITGGQEALGGVEQFLGLGNTGGAAGAAGGSGALASYNQFTKTPFYTFPLQQNLDTMDRAAAAKGMSLSGGQLADLGRYAGGYSASNFSNYMDALTKLSGLGATTSGQLGQIGTGIGQEVGQTAGNLAQAAQGGILGQAAGTNQALSGVPNLVNSLTGSNGLINSVNSAFGNQTGSSYGSSAPGTPGFSASGNPVMTGFAAPRDIGSFGNYIPPVV